MKQPQGMSQGFLKLVLALGPLALGLICLASLSRVASVEYSFLRSGGHATSAILMSPLLANAVLGIVGYVDGRANNVLDHGFVTASQAVTLLVFCLSCGFALVRPECPMTIAVDTLAMGLITMLVAAAMPFSRPNSLFGIRADGFRGRQRWRDLQRWGGARLLLVGALMVAFAYTVPSPFSVVASCALYAVWFFLVYRYLRTN